jgi:Carboxypeptidase regulatory-like domain
MGIGMPLRIPGAIAQKPLANLPGIIPSALPDAPEPSGSPVPSPTHADEEEQNQHSSSTGQSNGSISGTVQNLNGDIVSGAIVALEGPPAEERRTTVSSENGAFQFGGLKAGIPYRVTIKAPELQSWTSQAIILDPGQYFILVGINMRVPDVVTSVTVHADQIQIATEQVNIETKQRVFGFIPNFYVTYDPNAAPLTTGLKYKLALKSDTDVMTFVGVAFMSSLYQAGDIPDYGQGWDAYAKRMGAGYADTSTDIFFGGAILPSLLHQDPRYFYQGTGTKKSRTYHAIFSPFICKGDNGKAQPNYSSLGGDLISGAISNFYYPESNRGAGLVFQGFLVTTGVRVMNAVVQEFILRKLTPSARAKY